MIEKLVPLDLRPGVFRNGTKYQAKGRWFTSHLVRWFEGIMGPVGGWTAVMDNSTPPVALAVSGQPRGAHSWRANDGDAYLGIGTRTKLYEYKSGVLTDITPAGFTSGIADGTNAGGSGTYGDGVYGAGVYSSGSRARTITEADTWTLDNFGEDLVGVFTADARMLTWDKSVGGIATVMAGSPSAHAVVVTPEHFVFALGAAGESRRVAWPSQDSLTDWTPTATNTAGGFTLASEGKILSGGRLRRQTLIFTDTDLQAASYIGGDLVYRFDQIGDNCGLLAPNAFAMASGAAYWMSEKKFFLYDGAVQEITCDVSDYVFNDLNQVQRAKIWAAPMPQYNEVWWFYPSASQTGTECDKYVAYNYREGTWMIGNLARAAGVGRGVFDAPIWLKSTGGLFEHEIGNDKEGDKPFAESGPVEFGDGDQLMRVQEIVPDDKAIGDVKVSFFVANNPTDTERTVGPFLMNASPRGVRFTARQARQRIEEVNNVDWRVGIYRLAGLPSGRR